MLHIFSDSIPNHVAIAQFMIIPIVHNLISVSLVLQVNICSFVEIKHLLNLSSHKFIELLILMITRMCYY